MPLQIVGNGREHRSVRRRDTGNENHVGRCIPDASAFSSNRLPTMNAIANYDDGLEKSSEQTSLEAFERDEDTCVNGHEYCCGPDGITVTDDGFEHSGHFPYFKCFMQAVRNADREVLS
jgi:hypothetical protein